MQTPSLPAIRALRPAWNKDRIVGQKRPLKPKHVWAIRVRLELAQNHRDLAFFNLAIDSKLRGCDLVKMKDVDVMASGQIKERASVLQSKTQKPVRFEISEGTRASLARWMREPLMVGSEYLWPGRFHERLHISTRQYARIVRDWVTSIGLEASAYGTHSMRRTKVTQIYKKTGNLRAVQLLLGHTKMDSTVRYLGVELEDALRFQRPLKSNNLGRLRGRPIPAVHRPAKMLHPQPAYRPFAALAKTDDSQTHSLRDFPDLEFSVFADAASFRTRRNEFAVSQQISRMRSFNAPQTGEAQIDHSPRASLTNKVRTKEIRADAARSSPKCLYRSSRL